VPARREQPTLSLEATVFPLMMAWLCSIVLYGLWSVVTDHGPHSQPPQPEAAWIVPLLIIFAVVSGGLAAVAVLPILIFLPGARQPPLWAGALWGVCVALVGVLALGGLMWGPSQFTAAGVPLL
jgi:hypothetical protein